MGKNKKKNNKQNESIPNNESEIIDVLDDGEKDIAVEEAKSSEENVEKDIVENIEEENKIDNFVKQDVLKDNKTFDVKKRNLLIGIGCGIVVFILFLFLLVIPSYKYKNAINCYNNGEYEDAFKNLKGNNYSYSSDLLDVVKTNIAKDAIKSYIQNDPILTGLEFNSIDNIDIKQDKDYESINFDISYKNNKYILSRNFDVIKIKNDNNEWEVDKTIKNDSIIIPLVKCSEAMAHERAEREYLELTYTGESDLETTKHVFYYSFLNEENPSYMSDYTINVIYTFNEVSGNWYFDSITKEENESSKLSNKQYDTTFISIELPENWKLNADEQSITGFDGHDPIYCQYYNWYTSNKLEKKVGLKIRIKDYKYDITEEVKNESENSELGYGYDEYSQDYYGNSFIKGTYMPLIDGKYKLLEIEYYGNNMSDYNLILDSIKLTKRTYTLKAIAESINIRNYPSLDSYFVPEIVGKVKKGEIVTATLIYVDDDYTWYKIGEDMWVANNGNWFEVEIDEKQ